MFSRWAQGKLTVVWVEYSHLTGLLHSGTVYFSQQSVPCWRQRWFLVPRLTCHSHTWRCYLPENIVSYLKYVLKTKPTFCINDNIISYLLTYLLAYLLTYSLTHSLTHSPTPRSRILLEKLTGSQLLKKFPAFYGNRRFITAFTRFRHLSLSWARSIQSIPLHRISWRSILILSFHLRLGLPSSVFSLRFSHQNSVYVSVLPIRVTCPTGIIILDEIFFSNNTSVLLSTP